MKGGCVSPELQPGLTCGKGWGWGGGTGEVGEKERRDERGKSEMKNVLKLWGEETGRSSRPWGIKIDPEEVPSKCNSIWITQAVSVSRLLLFSDRS